VAGVVELLEGETLLRHVDQLKDSAFNASVTAWHFGRLGIQRSYARAASNAQSREP
jgi:hypothetical protein